MKNNGFVLFGPEGVDGLRFGCRHVLLVKGGRVCDAERCQSLFIVIFC